MQRCILSSMDTTTIIAEIDKQIATLLAAKALLSGAEPKAKPGRPKGSKSVISAAGKARIAAAQKARWADKRASQK